MITDPDGIKIMLPDKLPLLNISNDPGWEAWGPDAPAGDEDKEDKKGWSRVSTASRPSHLARGGGSAHTAPVCCGCRAPPCQHSECVRVFG